MKKAKSIFVFITGIFCVISCKNRTPAEKYSDYIADPSNHICYKEKVNDARIVLKYIPVEQQKFISKNETSKAVYSDNIYFDMKFSKPGLKKDKSKDLYLDFDIQNDFQLDINNKLLIPAICQKIGNGIKDEYEYIIAFDETPLEFSQATKADLIYTDKMFSVGQRKYTFKKQDILKIPKLTDQ